MASLLFTKLPSDTGLHFGSPSLYKTPETEEASQITNNTLTASHFLPCDIHFVSCGGFPDCLVGGLSVVVSIELSALEARGSQSTGSDLNDTYWILSCFQFQLYQLQFQQAATVDAATMIRKRRQMYVLDTT